MADVQRSAFSISSATLMMAPAFEVDVFSLDPINHSVGMVSEIKVSVGSSLLKLPNGAAQVPVDSRRVGIDTTITGNIFEWTAKNFSYSQGLKKALKTTRRGIITALTSTSVTYASNPIPGEVGLTTILAGETLLFQSKMQPDMVFPATLSADAAGNVATFANTPIPNTMSFQVGDTIWALEPIGGGQIDGDHSFGVKITGVLSNYNKPIVCVFPKVRVGKGFELTFSETSYSSMPWELSPMILTNVEATGRLADVGSKRPFLLYAGDGGSSSALTPPSGRAFVSLSDGTLVQFSDNSYLTAVAA